MMSGQRIGYVRVSSLGSPALLMTTKRRISCLKKGCVTSCTFVNLHRFSSEISSVARAGNGLIGIIENDTAGEVRGSLKTAQIRAVFRTFSTLINC